MVIRFLVGTYTHIAQAPSLSEGVYMYELDTETLQARYLSSVRVKNPSWVAVNGRYAYTLSECGSESQLHSIAIEGNALQLTSSSPCPGDDPCHLVAMGDMLYAANYSSGSILAIKVNEDGTLGKTVQEIKFDDHGTSPRQLSAHIHNMAIAPCGTLMAASNLGGDCIYLLKINENGNLTMLHTMKIAPGCGPRHLAWDKSGTHLYLITELSNEIMVFVMKDNSLQLLQSITAEHDKGHGAAHIHIHPSGKWLYASVRIVNDGIALLYINGDGTLTRQAFYPTGKHPRHFAVTPCGTMLMCACRDKNAIELYRINPDDGTLSYLPGHDISVGLPVCITIM